MPNINHVIIAGHLGQDVQLRKTSGGKSVANLSVATSDGRGDNKKTEWHRVTLWESQAEVAERYLSKGSAVMVEGRIQTRDWTDKEGNKRQSTDIIGFRLHLLGKGAGKGTESDGSGDRGRSPDRDIDKDPPQQDYESDDIPF